MGKTAAVHQRFIWGLVAMKIMGWVESCACFVMGGMVTALMAFYLDDRPVMEFNAARAVQTRVLRGQVAMEVVYDVNILRRCNFHVERRLENLETGEVRLIAGQDFPAQEKTGLQEIRVMIGLPPDLNPGNWKYYALAESKCNPGHTVESRGPDILFQVYDPEREGN